MNPFDQDQTLSPGHDPQAPYSRPADVRGPFRFEASRGPEGTGTIEPTANGRRDFALPGNDELDALADLFLGPGEDDQSRRTARAGQREEPARAERVRIEGLVLGHLPVFAAAWASQYARHRAEELGRPVGIVRLASGTISVEVLGAVEVVEPAPGGWEQAVSQLAQRAGLILVRVDEPVEAELAGVRSLDGLRVLSGADDAAVVACYRKLKGLATAAEDSCWAMPAVALAVMGAERSTALDSHARIARAARAFLEADLAEPVIVERIGPTGASAIFRGPAALTPADLVRAMRAAELGGTDSAARAGVRPAPEPAEPVASRSVAAAAPGFGWVSGLIEGLTVLETRCPFAERVELAADAQGRLHLVAAQLGQHPEVSSAMALRDLVAAAAWARAHGALLRRAERALAEGGEAALHLVTDRREDARSLLGTAVRVHLVTRAQPGPMGLIAVSLED